MLDGLVCGGERLQEFGDELCLWLLAYDREDHPDTSGRRERFHAGREFTVLREEQIVARGDFPIERAVRQSLQPELDETFREVLIEQNEIGKHTSELQSRQ